MFFIYLFVLLERYVTIASSIESERNVSPIATVKRVANENGTSVTSNGRDLEYRGRIALVI